jgi:hypothetical protein
VEHAIAADDHRGEAELELFQSNQQFSSTKDGQKAKERGKGR